jgi:hypothetical protein
MACARSVSALPSSLALNAVSLDQSGELVFARDDRPAKNELSPGFPWPAPDPRPGSSLFSFSDIPRPWSPSRPSLAVRSASLRPGPVGPASCFAWLKGSLRVPRRPKQPMREAQAVSQRSSWIVTNAKTASYYLPDKTRGDRRDFIPFCSFFSQPRHRRTGVRPRAARYCLRRVRCFRAPGW